ncbi:Zinc finger BED domain-containing protein DAYSLEEPER [Linum grandiflorum]
MEMDFSVSDGASVVPEEHNDSDDTPIVNSGSKRFRTRTLDAWNYFNRVVVVDEKGTRREKATCKACEKIYWSLSFSKSGTSTLNRHTDKSHYIDENVWKIHLQLLQICSSSDDVLKNMGNLMLLKFKKYWEDYNLVLAFGVILDPRYKVDFVKFCYEKLGGDYSNKWLDIREQLYLMFEEYQNMNGSVLDSTTSTLDISTDLDTDEFDSFHVNLRRSGKSELQLYLEDPLLPRVKEVNGVRISHVIDVLEWWKKIEYRYPQLSRMARDILSIPITSVASESSFSLGGRVLNKWRTCILSDTLEALMTTRNWLYGYKIEEDGEGIEDEGEVINLI